MKLYRPYIPLDVRCAVAARQLLAHDALEPRTTIARSVLYGLVGTKGAARLLRLLQALASTMVCTVKDLHLDHDPALGARKRRGEGKNTIYSPRANDPDHLIYREKKAHQIKTNVRGEHGQFPDRVLIKRERQRRNAKLGKVKRKVKIKSRGFDKTRTRKFNGTVERRS